MLLTLLLEFLPTKLWPNPSQQTGFNKQAGCQTIRQGPVAALGKCCLRLLCLPPVHTVVEQGVLEQGETALNGQSLMHRCLMHHLDKAKEH
jgi:hypothetical protein